MPSSAQLKLATTSSVLAGAPFSAMTDDWSWLVHDVLMTYYLFITYYMFKIYYLPMTCSWLVLYFLMTCLCLIHNLFSNFRTCLWLSCLDLFITCSWRVHELFMNCTCFFSWVAHDGALFTCSWLVHHLSVTFSSLVYHLFMTLLDFGGLVFCKYPQFYSRKRFWNERLGVTGDQEVIFFLGFLLFSTGQNGISSKKCLLFCSSLLLIL